MNLAQARKIALAFPETNEEPHFELTSFRTHKKIFATGTPDQQYLHVFVDSVTTAAAVADDPAACEQLWWGKKMAGLRITLKNATPAKVAELLEDSWRKRAPKKVVAEFDKAKDNK